ncbi:hypothetical protein R3I93_004758 [Phoxinus phoxinus]|uniref:Ig-like domain-containing protein n=1 Tax=Phoxinus phoxinus TaxID=58324 RepID=A0AAN9DE55_9TELE
MSALGEVSGLCICLILSRLFNAVTSIVYIENGTRLSLNPNIQEKPEDILWTHNGNKVAEHELNHFQDYGQFRGRSEIDVSSGQLTVHNMTRLDNGIYRSVIQINGKLQSSENEVEVIDAVPQPNVTCKLNNISRALFCSVSSQSNVSYEWTGSGSAQVGQELHIRREEPDSVYTCTVKNAVSQKSSRFSLRDCLTDEPQEDQNINPPGASSVIAAAVVGIIAVAVAVAGAVAVAIYFIKRRHVCTENSRRYAGETHFLPELNPQGGSSGNPAPTNDREQRRTDGADGQEEEESETNPLNHQDEQKKSRESEKDGETEKKEDEEKILLDQNKTRREEPNSRNTEIT